MGKNGVEGELRSISRSLADVICEAARLQKKGVIDETQAALIDLSASAIHLALKLSPLGEKYSRLGSLR